MTMGAELLFFFTYIRGRILRVCTAALILTTVSAAGQTPGGSQASQGAQTGQQPVGPIVLPTVIVTAQKEPADAKTLPVSLTPVSGRTLTDAGITFVSDAAIYAPNTFFSELAARKISNANFRGIGSSPANPGITTYYDGVPQLNTNTSSLDLLHEDQIEFVRGPQSALFGRNSLGGLVNITSIRPSLMDWNGSLSVPFGNYGAREIRGGVSGPLVAGRLGLAVSLGHESRDGYTINDVTGNDLDHRSAFSGKGQLLWTPSSIWEARLIISGERARDGDYALNDLDALRQNPFHAARDFEGETNRDVFGTTVLTRREGQKISFSSTTGFVDWKTQDLTDLDYTPFPFATRDNTEDAFQFTQEVRLASAANARVRLSDRASLKWQSGLFFFTQNYNQDAVNTFSPFVPPAFLPFSFESHSPQSALDDWGLGVYGQATTTLNDRLDLSAGARVDYENKQAALNTFVVPPIVQANVVNVERDFSNVSPQAAITFRLQPDRMVYGTFGGGFKAGGFNPASPAGSESYFEEHTWHFEGGLKTTWAGGRLSTNVAAFYIDWTDLQLNLPNPFVPAQFYIANVGDARSGGFEVEVTARPQTGVDFFGALGYTHGRFKDGSSSINGDISGNELPNTPDYTATLGTQLSHVLTPAATLYGRAEVVFYGAFHYDDGNNVGQDAYSLANFRGGVRGRYVFAEAWVRNAFDTQYIPIAFAYPGFAPSGYVGESGRPRTFGISAGLTF
jgi:iron complex outermembrane receptor protein